jgi:hypothetical protein
MQHQKEMIFLDHVLSRLMYASDLFLFAINIFVPIYHILREPVSLPHDPSISNRPSHQLTSTNYEAPSAPCEVLLLESNNYP